MQFSLKSFLLAIALIASTCAGLLFATRMWAACFFSAVFLLLLFGVIAAIVRTGSKRAYWIGFTICGGVYFLFAVFADSQPHFGGSGGGILQRNEPYLVSSELLLWLDTRLNIASPSQPVPGGSDYLYSVYGSPIYFTARGREGHRLTIGHSAIAVLLGAIGGSFARRAVERR